MIHRGQCGPPRLEAGIFGLFGRDPRAVLAFSHPAEHTDPSRMSLPKTENQSLSRRTLLKSMGMAPLLFRAGPAARGGVAFRAAGALIGGWRRRFNYSDVRLMPHYPAKSPLADVLRLVTPGSDEFITEKYAVEIESLLKEWGHGLRVSARDTAALARLAGCLNRRADIGPRSGDDGCVQMAGWRLCGGSLAQSLHRRGSDFFRRSRRGSGQFRGWRRRSSKSPLSRNLEVLR